MHERSSCSGGCLLAKAYSWSGVIQQSAGSTGGRNSASPPPLIVNNSAEPTTHDVNNSRIFLMLKEETRIARLRIANAITLMIAERLSSRDDALWFDNESSRWRPVTEVYSISVSQDQSQRVFQFKQQQRRKT